MIYDLYTMYVERDTLQSKKYDKSTKRGYFRGRALPHAQWLPHAPIVDIVMLRLVYREYTEGTRYHFSYLANEGIMM